MPTLPSTSVCGVSKSLRPEPFRGRQLKLKSGSPGYASRDGCRGSKKCAGASDW
jgi:hypothetical protein